MVVATAVEADVVGVPVPGGAVVLVRRDGPPAPVPTVAVLAVAVFAEAPDVVVDAFDVVLAPATVVAVPTVEVDVDDDVVAALVSATHCSTGRR